MFERLLEVLDNYKELFFVLIVFIIFIGVSSYFQSKRFSNYSETKTGAEKSAPVTSTKHQPRKKAASANFNNEYINMWVLADCTAKPNKRYHISCDSPAVAGSGVSNNSYLWFNVCNVTEKALFVVSQKGRCAELMPARPGKTAKELPVGSTGAFQTNDLARLFRIPKSGRFFEWDFSKRRIAVQQSAVESQASSFGSPMRSVFLAFYYNRFWPVYVLFLATVFFIWMGAKVKAEADDHADDVSIVGWFYFRLVGVVSFYLLLVDASFENYGEVITSVESHFYDTVEAINDHYQYAYSAGFDGAQPLGSHLSALKNYPPVLGYERRGLSRLFSSWLSFSWVFLFIPAMVFFYAINAKNFVVGVFEVFGSSRHKHGFAGVRKQLPTVDDVTDKSSDFITAPFNKVYADMLARKNRRKAEELRARQKELESDTEVSEAEREFEIRKQYIDKLKLELDCERKDFYGKGQRRKRD